MCHCFRTINMWHTSSSKSFFAWSSKILKEYSCRVGLDHGLHLVVVVEPVARNFIMQSKSGQLGNLRLSKRGGGGREGEEDEVTVIFPFSTSNRFLSPPSFSLSLLLPLSPSLSLSFSLYPNFHTRWIRWDPCRRDNMQSMLTTDLLISPWLSIDSSPSNDQIELSASVQGKDDHKCIQCKIRRVSQCFYTKSCWVRFPQLKRLVKSWQ